MTDVQKYGNLNIPRERYNKIVKEWKTRLSKESDLSFTMWVTRVLESTLMKQVFVSKMFPDLKVLSSDGSFVIENHSKNEVVKVFLKDGKIDCTANQNKEDYILFACLHPLFSLSTN